MDHRQMVAYKVQLKFLCIRWTRLKAGRMVAIGYEETKSSNFEAKPSDMITKYLSILCVSNVLQVAFHYIINLPVNFFMHSNSMMPQCLSLNVLSCRNVN